MTGGFELAVNCDFLVASEHARFADTHARIGVQPGWGLTVLLPQAIGLRRAKEMSATGNYIDAATALAWGLVNHVVPHDDLMPFCLQLAADIVSNDRAGVRAIFETYNQGAETTVTDAWTIEARNANQWLLMEAVVAKTRRAVRQSNLGANPRPADMLEMRSNCERCEAALVADGDARICSYECTFCPDCTTNVLRGRCPNCGGELVPRPRRKPE